MSPEIDRDYAEQTFTIVETALGEVGKELKGANPKVGECYRALETSVRTAHHEIDSAERTIDRVLKDNTIYPVGRHELAAAALAKAQDAVDKTLSSSKAAGQLASIFLEEEAMPKVEGTDAEQTALREEVRDAMSRSTDHIGMLVTLARDPRYAALVASPFGRSVLRGRVEERDVERAHELVRSEVLSRVIEHGTEAQRNAAARSMLGGTMKAVHLGVSSYAQTKLEKLSAKVSVAGAQAHEPILNVPQKLRQALKR